MIFHIELTRGFTSKQINLLLGVARNETRRMLYQFDMLNIRSRPETDYYPEEGFSLGFDNSGLVNFVEISSPSIIYVGTKQLIGSDQNLARDAVSLSLKLEPMFDDGGLYWLSSQLCMQVNDSLIQSVAIFSRGYYFDFYGQ